jgi:hypothetical protein
MNKFRALGFIDYNGDLVILISLNVVLHDNPAIEAAIRRRIGAGKVDMTRIFKWFVTRAVQPPRPRSRWR